MNTNNHDDDDTRPDDDENVGRVEPQDEPGEFDNGDADDDNGNGDGGGGEPTPDPQAIVRDIPKREYSNTVTTVNLSQTANEAIQAALEKKGTVRIGPGDYWIDCAHPVLIRSNTYVQILPGARFYAIPHGLQRSQMFKVENVNNVRVTGGEFYGERNDHDFSDTSGTGTHEWNHCFAVWSATACTFEDMQIQDFTGDAYSVGGGGQGTKPPSQDIALSKIIGTNCYRQGLSITNSRNVRVYDCHFLKINGTSPECGIDVEPEYGQRADDVQIVGCYLAECAKYGFNALHRTGASNPGGEIRNLLVAECTIEKNKSNGAYAHGVDGLKVQTCNILTNNATGFVISLCPDYVYQANESGFNYARNPLSKPRTPFTQTGWTSKIERDVLLRNGSPTNGCKTSRYV